MEKNENIVTNANKSGQGKRNVPTLRFKTFAAPWEQKTFDEIFWMLTNNTLSRAELNYNSGVCKNIHYGDVLIRFPAHIDISSSDVPYINDQSFNSKLNCSLLQSGDIVIADTAEDLTVGKATEIENKQNMKVSAGLHTIPCRPKIKFSPRYLGYYINSPAYHDQLIPFIQGIKVSSISKTLIRKTFISFPSIFEQSKIATFLSCLDKKIDAQNKIISKYETLIKGLCDLLLSNTNTVILPLKSIATINKGQQINGLALAKTGEYYYLNGGISPSGYVQEYNTSENTISISEGGNSCGFVAYNTQKFWSGGHCYTLKIINTKCRSKFLYFYLKHREKDIMQLRVGSGLPNIQKRSLENFAVALPSVEKQCYIEHILECITVKKEIETDLLRQFQSQKKLLLSKMFI